MTDSGAPAGARALAEQDRPPNFRNDSGRLFLVRCFVCEPSVGRENWAPAVASGCCAFCNWPNGVEQPATENPSPQNPALDSEAGSADA
jgi:hypothetical protein